MCTLMRGVSLWVHLLWGRNGMKLGFHPETDQSNCGEHRDHALFTTSDTPPSVIVVMQILRPE